MNDEVIILIGPEGVGKSLVGSELAKNLGYKWVDSDIYLHDVLKFPRKQDYDEQEFMRKKELELEVLKFVLDKKKVVFSSGEGLILHQESEILGKVEDMLRNSQNVILLYSREKECDIFYEYAKKTVDVDDKTTTEIVNEVIDFL